MVSKNLLRIAERLGRKDAVIGEVKKPDQGETPRFAPDIMKNPQDYISVPGVNGLHGNPVFISKFEVQGMNGKNYENIHKQVLQSQNGLYIPTPAIFMPHFKNVVETYNNHGVILDAAGYQISRQGHEEIYKHLTTNFKDIYGHNQPGAWTWLNARFVLGTGFNNLDLETIIGIEQNGNLKAKTEPLMPFLNENAYAELIFNQQGLVTTRAGNQKYEQGKNVRFYSPVRDAVARFGAGSDGAGFGCNGDPRYSNPELGVFLCAEGVPKN